MINLLKLFTKLFFNQKIIACFAVLNNDSGNDSLNGD